MAKIDSISSAVTAEKWADTARSIETKLNDICLCISAIKHIVYKDEDAGPLGTAIDVLASQVGATADSIIINELKSAATVGNMEAWLSHKG